MKAPSAEMEKILNKLRAFAPCFIGEVSRAGFARVRFLCLGRGDGRE